MCVSCAGNGEGGGKGKQPGGVPTSERDDSPQPLPGETGHGGRSDGGSPAGAADGGRRVGHGV